MDDPITKIGIGAGSGLVGIMLGWLGFKAKVENLQTDMTALKKNVRYQDTCLEVHKAVDSRLKAIEGMQTEMRDDIKLLIRR